MAYCHLSSFNLIQYSLSYAVIHISNLRASSKNRRIQRQKFPQDSNCHPLYRASLILQISFLQTGKQAGHINIHFCQAQGRVPCYLKLLLCTVFYSKPSGDQNLTLCKESPVKKLKAMNKNTFYNCKAIKLELAGHDPAQHFCVLQQHLQSRRNTANVLKNTHRGGAQPVTIRILVWSNYGLSDPAFQC